MKLHESILQKLTSAGYQAYLVGGCVRDTLLGKTPKDYDVTTSARPEQVKEIFPEAKFVGEQFGVSLVSEGSETVEVATFRADGAYKDNRHPESVRFTDNIYEDLARRDFTMNAIAININGEYICEDGYLEDIDNHLVRCVGDAKLRFQEDALRMMRAVRFTSQHYLMLDGEAKKAVRENGHLLENISKERIAIEFNKLLMGYYVKDAIDRLWDLGLHRYLFKNIVTWPSLWDDIWKLFNIGALESNLHVRLAAFFLYFGKETVKQVKLGYIAYPNMAATSAGIARAWMTEYKYSNSDINKVEILLKGLQVTDNYLEDSCEDKAKWKRLMRSTNFESVVKLLHADRLASTDKDSSDAKFLMDLYEGYKKEGLSPQPLLTGDDLIRMGRTPSPQFKEILYEVETAQLDGHINNHMELVSFMSLRGL